MWVKNVLRINLRNLKIASFLGKLEYAFDAKFRKFVNALHF